VRAFETPASERKQCDKKRNQAEPMRVLLIEDSAKLRRVIELGLHKAGYAVDVACNGKEALWQAEGHDYDVIILETRLPGEDGLSVLKHLHTRAHRTPVLAVSPVNSLEDRIHWLREGADDCVSKPFAFEDLLVRIHCLVRRKHGCTRPVIHFGDVELNTNDRTVRWAGIPVELTPREYRLLEYLALNQGKVMSRTEIEEHIYNENAEIFSNVVESTISALRKKFVRMGSLPVIETRRGMGYVLQAPLPQSS
jgi:DNA-binding response OmpR family regulator